MNLPTFTIGIPTYNAALHLERAWQSAVSQDIQVSQIIIVDDASKDSTPDIFQVWSARGPLAPDILILPENLGVAAARNKIIEMATGDFIVFFDDDDVSHPTRVQKQIEAILRYEEKYAHGAPVICHTARTQIFPDGTRRYMGTMGCVGDHGPAPFGLQAARGMMFGAPVPGGLGSLATCSQAARTSTYRMLGGFDPIFRRMEDTEFCLRLALAGGHFLGLADPLVDQYISFPTDKKISAERQYAQQLFDKHQDFFKNQGRGTFDRDWWMIRHDFLEKKNKSFIKSLVKIAVSYPWLTGQKIYRALPNVMGHVRQRFWGHRAAS